MSKQLKILITNGKTQLFYDNFQIVNSLNMVQISNKLFTVLKDSKGWYIPSNSLGNKNYIVNLIEKGEEIFFVS